ncbi:bifunctional glutathione transferase/peroxidase [Elasticomyces elasticus]|uniref:Bifunctional glutathione transferase/peroxidase n=1 Tax=Exophiala sideris TaxID=1016849 RepID=A0ABR0IWI3_9EURO|nr:bifunctional glutathione transferase/peroxidase [Elasticomyces elasticus]KAK5021292.1 bifunctional glutathione transferase/peroxidase [Exophiala sideris]KAK5024237.1 bifunctional glutathione transferase/peroxidase [Exophiala sideris]KAK5049179.1 bifunctional glutathione transferase/peroxidase [Exophiala sideris]KAK5176490.1 bifunctional glutathione transferase/peroxidase [Eurotiomycetes sp. CCFEE 6388]
MSSAPKENAQPKVTLHWLETSRSHRILWFLEEMGIPYELKTYKRTKESLAPPELKEIHPLGKSPVVELLTPGSTTPIVLAESAAIVEYFCDYYGQWLVPRRYQAGKDGQIGGETESWLRYRMLMHYAEGSFMPFMVLSVIVNRIRNSPVWFFIKPITAAVASTVETGFLSRNFKTHYEFLEGQLATSPDGGKFLCGKDLTGADIMMSFPLEAGQSRTGFSKEQYPKVWDYVERLHEREAYKRAVARIIELEGQFKTTM